MQNCVWKKRPKNTSGGPSGDPFWDPKWPQIDVGGTKIAKIFDQKSSWNEFRIPDGPRIASGTFPGGGHILLDQAGEIHPACKGESPSHLDSKDFSWAGVSPPSFGDFLDFVLCFVVCFGSSLLFLSLGSFKIHFEMVFLLCFQLLREFGRFLMNFETICHVFSIVFTCFSENFQT